jgi:hypothetical protein
VEVVQCASTKFYISSVPVYFITYKYVLKRSYKYGAGGAVYVTVYVKIYCTTLNVPGLLYMFLVRRTRLGISGSY